MLSNTLLYLTWKIFLYPKIFPQIVSNKSMGDNLGVGFKYEDVFELCQKAVGS